MRVFLDTNVILSAALFPTDIAATAYRMAVAPPFEPITSEYVLSELRSVFAKKFPDKLSLLENFIVSFIASIPVADTPLLPVYGEAQIRDMDDIPILRAAVACGADVILTGDKDLLEAGLSQPLVMSPAHFLELASAQ